MKLINFCVIVLFVSVLCSIICSGDITDNTTNTVSGLFKNITLPAPVHSSDNSLDNALEKRRSIRVFESKPLSSGDLSVLLWAGQGITNTSSGQRTAPSAMRTYPLTLHIVVNNVTGINPGVYAYDPQANILIQELNETEKKTVLDAIAGRRPGDPAPVTMIVEANYSPFLMVQGTEPEAIRHASLEAGHVVQNILLMETSRGLAGTPFTGFNTSQVEEALNISGNNHIIYAVSAGYPDI